MYCPSHETHFVYDLVHVGNNHTHLNPLISELRKHNFHFDLSNITVISKLGKGHKNLQEISAVFRK